MHSGSFLTGSSSLTGDGVNDVFAVGVRLGDAALDSAFVTFSSEDFLIGAFLGEEYFGFDTFAAHLEFTRGFSANDIDGSVTVYLY